MIIFVYLPVDATAVEKIDLPNEDQTHVFLKKRIVTAQIPQCLQLPPGVQIPTGKRDEL